MKSFKVIISGGGTGGHIYPAIAIAKEILVERSNADILFVGANGRMEMEKIPEYGFNIIGLNIVGIQRSLSLNSIIKNLKFPFLLLKSFNEAKKVLIDFKPNVVIGVGGYASGPTLRMAHQIGIPTLIQEQNSFAGLTNKWLSKRTKRICVAYTKMDQFFESKKIVITGNPVRNDILNLENKKEEAKSYFKIKKNQKVILVLGGSLGAKSINEGIKKSIHLLSSKNIHLLWQVGKRYYVEIESWVRQKKINNVKAMAFVNRMDLAYSVSDVVISRAGALSISELTLAGKPSILVPSPNVSEDHQTKNAMSLVNHSAAIMVKDDQTDQLINKAISLLQSPKTIDSLSQSAKSLGKPNASKDIVKEIFKICEDER